MTSLIIIITMLIMSHIIIYSDFIAYILRNNGTNNDICYTLQKQHQLSYERVHSYIDMKDCKKDITL